MKIKNQKDFFSGLLFMSVGVTFAWGANNYNIGSGAHMGPGYFPLLLGILMAVLGAVITLQGLIIETKVGDKIGKWAWKPLFFIIASNLVFGLALGGLPSIGIPAMGMIFGIFALTFISSLAGEEFNFKAVAVLSTVLSIMSYVAFIVLLKLQFPVWPAFITG